MYDVLYNKVMSLQKGFFCENLLNVTSVKEKKKKVTVPPRTILDSNKTVCFITQEMI